MENFNIFEDFWKSDAQYKVIFAEEYKKKVPSKIMWACFLFIHPNSKFANLPSDVKEELISGDYIPFKAQEYKDTIDKIKTLLLTPIQRMLVSWNESLLQRERFMDSLEYSPTTYEMLDKMRKDTYQMAKQYKEIYNEFEKERDVRTHGDVSESLSEQGLI